MKKKNVLFREQVRCASAGWHIDMDRWRKREYRYLGS